MPRYLFLGSLLLTTACGPAQQKPHDTTRPVTRPKPRPKPSDAPERVQLIYTDIDTAKENSAGKRLLGPILKKYVKTKIPKECRGDLATDLFKIIKVPKKHDDLPTAKLNPGILVFVLGKKFGVSASGPGQQPDTDEERHSHILHLCAITASPRSSDGTLVVKVDAIMERPPGRRKFTADWREPVAPGARCPCCCSPWASSAAAAAVATEPGHLDPASCPADCVSSRQAQAHGSGGD